MAEMGDIVPGPNQLGLGESLHAHVRDIDHGRLWPEPQEDRFQPELDLVSVLSQQGRFSGFFLGVYNDNADTACRLYCSSAALSMSSSSSAYISFPSPLLCCRRLSCSRSPARKAPPRSLATLLTPFHPVCLPARGVPVLWSWHVPTSWTAFGPG